VHLGRLYGHRERPMLPRARHAPLDFGFEARVARSIHLAHAAGSHQRDDLVPADRRAWTDHERVKCGRLYPDDLGRNFPNDIVLFAVTASIERSHTMSDVWREAEACRSRS
jgi:hypothetical protein